MRDKDLKREEVEASHTLASHTLAGEGGILAEGRGEEARGLVSGRGGEGVQIFFNNIHTYTEHNQRAPCSAQTP